jgi:hypothetical protein
MQGSNKEKCLSSAAASGVFAEWREQGLFLHAVAILTKPGCSDLSDVRARGYTYFAKPPEYGRKTLPGTQ